MLLFGGSQRVDDPSDMLVTVAAEDVFDASPELSAATMSLLFDYWLPMPASALS